MKLKELGEFRFIDRVAARFPLSVPGGLQGIGDDCAVLPQSDGQVLLVTTDMLIENIHFLLNAIPPEDLGYKSLAVNLSDIAAMGGTPQEVFLSLALNPETELSFLERFLDGFQELCTATGVQLLGGDTTSSPGPLAISVTVLGSMPADQVRLRSLARPGDVVCVSGPVGDSDGGLRLLLQGLPSDDANSAYLIRRHQRPRPHLEAGRWLARQAGVHAMMDLSDGIASDLCRITQQSRCGAEVRLEELPYSPALGRVAKRHGWDPMEIAVSGGEDYCLLCTVDTQGMEKVRRGFEETLGVPLFPIGSITANEGEIRYLLEGKEVTLRHHGFNHFRKDASP